MSRNQLEQTKNRTDSVWLKSQLTELAAYLANCGLLITSRKMRAAVLFIESGHDWREALK